METTGQNATKKCKICGKQKDITKFHKNGTWTRPECAVCTRERQKNYHEIRKKHKTPPLGTPCECCGDSTSTLHWDHDHETGGHRGWICSNCNTGIGKLGDNVEGVLQGLTYLVKAGKVSKDQEDTDGEPT